MPGAPELAQAGATRRSGGATNCRNGGSAVGFHSSPNCLHSSLNSASIRRTRSRPVRLSTQGGSRAHHTGRRQQMEQGEIKQLAGLPR